MVITNDDMRDWDYTFEVSVDHDAIDTMQEEQFKIKSIPPFEGI